MSELKNCPFCGGESLLRDRYINGVANTKHYIRECRHCKATFAHWYRSMKKADEAWNRRAKPENKPLTLDELRGMDGEPVWVENVAEPFSGGNWAIATFHKGGHDEGIILCDAIYSEYFAAFSLYGDSWLAYRHKPERSEGE